MPVPTSRLVLAALAGAVLVALVPGSLGMRLLVVDGLLLALVVVDWLLAPRASGFELQRELPKVITLGGSDTLTWRVRGRSGRSFRIAVADELAPSLGLCRRIVDLVSTGATLEANNLVEVETIAEITSRLVVNRAAMKTRASEVGDYVERFREAARAA